MAGMNKVPGCLQERVFLAERKLLSGSNHAATANNVEAVFNSYGDCSLEYSSRWDDRCFRK